MLKGSQWVSTKSPEKMPSSKNKHLHINGMVHIYNTVRYVQALN